MITTTTVTGPKGKVLLTFGIYALKNFTIRLGCSTEVYSLLAAFQGGTRVTAMMELIRTGFETTTAEAGKPETMTDYEACQVMETATAEESNQAFKAFFTSVLNEDYDTWFNRLQDDYNQAVGEDSEQEGESDEGEKKSEAGTKSKQKPTAKSA